METTADRKLEQAKDNINEAISNLSEIVINRCQGEDEYNQTFRMKMKACLNELLDIREELGA